MLRFLNCDALSNGTEVFSNCSCVEESRRDSIASTVQGYSVSGEWSGLLYELVQLFSLVLHCNVQTSLI